MNKTKCNQTLLKTFKLEWRAKRSSLLGKFTLCRKMLSSKCTGLFNIYKIAHFISLDLKKKKKHRREIVDMKMNILKVSRFRALQNFSDICSLIVNASYLKLF